MAGSGRLVDYLGYGLAASRPASITPVTSGLALWYSYDTVAVSIWDTHTSAWISFPGSGTGTVTSVGLSLPAIFTVTGSPVTTTGTLTATLATQTANYVWAGPTSGAAAAPTFRALVAADFPAGVGTVTSVAMTVPADFTVTGSPVTTSGTLAVTENTQSANTVKAGPSSGTAAAPTYRALVTADLPAGTTQTIASGTAALGTTAIASGAAATTVTVTATGVATTDVIDYNFNGDPTAVTGYAPSVSGMLTIIAYPTANNVNFIVANNTASSITPGAITLNWRVLR